MANSAVTSRAQPSVVLNATMRSGRLYSPESRLHRLPIGLLWVCLPVRLTKAAEVVQHQIHGIVVGGALDLAPLRLAGALRGGLLSCVMLRLSASIRLIIRRGAAKVGLSSWTAPAALALR